jgi:hypothetical protein
MNGGRRNSSEHPVQQAGHTLATTPITGRHGIHARLMKKASITPEGPD